MTKFSNLTEKQSQALKLLLKNVYKEILFDGGSRAGKTFLVLVYCILLCMNYKGMRMLVARLRFAHAKASIWLQTLMPMLTGMFSDLKIIINRSDYIVRINDNEIWLGGLDDKDRVDKILGQEYCLIFLNEAVDIAEGTRDIVKTRLAQKIDGFKNVMIYDCNPRHPMHYLHKEFIEEKHPDRARIHWLPDDNIENLPEDYIQSLEQLKGDKRKRFRDGIWASLPGAVYDNIKAENIIETNKDLNYYDDITCGVDFGLNTAFSMWGIKGDKAYCITEVRLFGAKETTTKKIIDNLLEIFGLIEYNYPIYCDHEPDRIQELCEAGFNALKAYKDVEPGDASVNEYELYFDITCKHTFQSMLNLRHKEDITGAFIEAHVKENDHEADGARYALHGQKIDNGNTTGVLKIKGIM